MQKIKLFILVILLAQSPLFGQNTIVERYGQLSVKGNYIRGQNGDTVQLRGMSLFWSQWMPKYYNSSAVKWLKDEWKCTVVRAAMGVEHGGYLTNPEVEKGKVMEVVDAAIKHGIYVLIDYHSHEAHKNPEPAKKFFSEMAKKYGAYPNVIYEIYNEPLGDANWSKDIKPYSEAIVAAIREHDPDNIIILGTRRWSQLVHEASRDRVKDPNVVYSLHFYATTHRKELRDEAERALQNGVAIFVSEFGTTEASGDGRVDHRSTREWLDFMDKYKISWCNWSVADKAEASAALKPGSSGMGRWREEEITESGKLVRKELILKNTPLISGEKKEPAPAPVPKPKKEKKGKK